MVEGSDGKFLWLNIKDQLKLFSIHQIKVYKTSITPMRAKRRTDKTEASSESAPTDTAAVDAPPRITGATTPAVEAMPTSATTAANMSAVINGTSPAAHNVSDVISPADALVNSRRCHEYIREDYIRALYPYPLRIRAGDAYPKCIMRTGGEDISILTDRKCEIISDPYPRYESQDTGIYMVVRVPAHDEFCLSAVVLSFCVPQIGGEMSEHLAATSGDPARPGKNRSTTRLDPIALLSECDTRFRAVILTSVYANGGEPPRRRPLDG